jgi:hypothetical protein
MRLSFDEAPKQFSMADMNRYWLARAGVNHGLYELTQLCEMLASQDLLVDDHFCEEGTETWLTLAKFAKMHAPKKEPWQADLVTEKQSAYLAFLGFSVPATKGEAAALIQVASDNPLLEKRCSEWRAARLFLHPELYAEEKSAMEGGREELKKMRAAVFRDCINEAASEPEMSAFKRITLKEAKAVVDYMDELSPGWDTGEWGEQRNMFENEMLDLLERALALRFPEKIRKGWEFKFEL